MKIKVEIEVDGTLLARLEDERPEVARDAVNVISNMANMEANLQVAGYVDKLERERTEKRRKEEAAAKAAEAVEKE